MLPWNQGKWGQYFLPFLLFCMQCCRHYLYSAFHCSAIKDCDLTSELPVMMHLFLYHSTGFCQPWSKSSESITMCSSFSVPVLISSAVIQSDISMHDSIALMVVHIPGISSSLSHSCVWIASLLMNSCSQGLCSIPMFFDVFLIVLFEICVIGLQHLSRIFLPVACDP